MFNENKQEFTKNLGRLLIDQTREYSDVRKIEYHEEPDTGQEWIYVTYRAHAQKRVNVNADSNSAMIVDFVKQLNDAPWLKLEEMYFSSAEDEIWMNFWPEVITSGLGKLIPKADEAGLDFSEKRCLNAIMAICEKWSDKKKEG